MPPSYENTLEQFDLHRLIVLLTITGAVLSSVSIVVTVLWDYFEHGTGVFSLITNQLGDYNRVSLAYVFNAGTLCYGMCTLMSMFGLYRLKLDRLSKILALIGTWLGISILLFGAFPLNFFSAHKMVSASMLVSTQLFCIVTVICKISGKRYCTKGMLIVSILLFFAAGYSLIQLDWNTLEIIPCTKIEETHYCMSALSSWAVMLLSILWDVLSSLNMRSIVIEHYQTLSLYHLNGN